MRAVVYARVSSAAQRERDTIASQLQVLPAHAASQGWPLVRPVQTYVDDGHTASAGHLAPRRGLAKLLRDAAAGVFDVVLVVDLDRLTRSEDITERAAIIGAFQRAGVKIATPSGQLLDLSTSTGDLFATLQAFFAAEENRKRRERVLRGKVEAARRGGKATGRDPYGLVFTKPDRWTLHPEQAPIAREIVERVAGGASCYAMADELNARGVPYAGLEGNTRWHRGRVYDLVRSRHVAGEYIAHAASHTVIAVPAIVDEDTWQRAQDALERNRKTPLRKTKHIYLLEGLARCGACGGRMFVKSGYRDLRRGTPIPSVYICENRKNRKAGPERCSAPKVLVADVDARAWAGVCRELEDPALPGALAAFVQRAEADVHEWSADVAGYEKHLQRLERVEQSILARFRRGEIEERGLDAELAALRRERAGVRRQLAAAERAARSERGAADRADVARRTLERLRAALAGATPAERRAILLNLIDPGGILFSGTAIRVELFMPRPASDDSDSGALVVGAACSDGLESRLRIRLVA